MLYWNTHHLLEKAAFKFLNGFPTCMRLVRQFPAKFLFSCLVSVDICESNDTQSYASIYIVSSDQTWQSTHSHPFSDEHAYENKRDRSWSSDGFAKLESLRYLWTQNVRGERLQLHQSFNTNAKHYNAECYYHRCPNVQPGVLWSASRKSLGFS